MTIVQTAGTQNTRGFAAGVAAVTTATNESHSTRLLLLAPADAELPLDFQVVDDNPSRHSELIADMQRLRGSVYLQDGAVGPDQLSSDGRHRSAIDRDCWHILAMDAFGNVCGCVRYYPHTNNACFRELWVRNSAIANCPTWGRKFRSAVESELRQARLRNVSYVEVGGWAISPDRRCSVEALRTALATYSLAQVLGGCLGITTATVRHHSSSILRRIGGASLRSDAGELPPYYDPQYDCEMEVLRFDSMCPTPKYAGMIDRLCSEILNIPVVCPSRRRMVQFFVPALANAGLRGHSFNQRPALQSA